MNQPPFDLQKPRKDKHLAVTIGAVATVLVLVGFLAWLQSPAGGSASGGAWPLSASPRPEHSTLPAEPVALGDPREGRLTSSYGGGGPVAARGAAAAASAEFDLSAGAGPARRRTEATGDSQFPDTARPAANQVSGGPARRAETMASTGGSRSGSTGGSVSGGGSPSASPQGGERRPVAPVVPQRAPPNIKKLPKLPDPKSVKDPSVRRSILAVQSALQRREAFGGGGLSRVAAPGVASSGGISAASGASGYAATGVGASSHGAGPTGAGAAISGASGVTGGGGAGGAPPPGSTEGIRNGPGAAATPTNTGTGTTAASVTLEPETDTPPEPGDPIGEINNTATADPAVMQRDANEYIQWEHSAIVVPGLTLARQLVSKQLSKIKLAEQHLETVRSALLADTAAGGRLRQSPLTDGFANMLRTELLPILTLDAANNSDRTIEPIRQQLRDGRLALIEASTVLNFHETDQDVPAEAWSRQEKALRLASAWLSNRDRYYTTLKALALNPGFIADEYKKKFDELKGQCDQCLSTCRAALVAGAADTCEASCADTGCTARDNVGASADGIKNAVVASYTVLETAAWSSLDPDERNLVPWIAAGTGHAQFVLVRFVNNYKQGNALGWKLRTSCERPFLLAVYNGSVEWVTASWSWLNAALPAESEDRRAGFVIDGMQGSLTAHRLTRQAKAKVFDAQCAQPTN